MKAFPPKKIDIGLIMIFMIKNIKLFTNMI